MCLHEWQFYFLAWKCMDRVFISMGMTGIGLAETLRNQFETKIDQNE